MVSLMEGGTAVGLPGRDAGAAPRRSSAGRNGRATEALHRGGSSTANLGHVFARAKCAPDRSRKALSRGAFLVVRRQQRSHARNKRPSGCATGGSAADKVASDAVGRAPDRGG
jgi:hypothetical protein